MARSTRRTDHYTQTGDFGYYQRTNLETLIDNFMIAYIGDGKVLTKVPRYEVAFHMQRCIQEFSYDMFHGEGNIEIELGPTLQLVLPNDFVSYIEVKRSATRDGQEIFLTPAPRQNATKGILQDENYEPFEDEDGNLVAERDSDTYRRWIENTQISDVIRSDYFYDNYDGDFHDNYYTFYGRRYGLQPSDATSDGTFIIDNDAGIIYFDSTTQEGDTIILRYITDGIGQNDDLANVRVPKLAEAAVYANTLYSLAKLRPAAAQALPLYKKEAKAMMNNAKIRLMDLRPIEMKNVLRNKAKWIKH